MLFSNPEVADYLNENFECAWHSVRPVPSVTVDFGNGTTLQRTVLGNVATWYCFADGTVFDALPGLVDPVEYLRRAKAAVSTHGRIAGSRDRWRDAVAALLRAEHENRPSRRRPGPNDMTKTVGETPLRRAIGDRTALSEALLRAAPGDAASLLADTSYNRAWRYPATRRLLTRQAAAPTPAGVRGRMFTDVLHVPIDDPFLGLAPDVLGGEGGRVLRGVPVSTKSGR